MKNSRLLTTALVLGLSVALFVAPACAWEFSMDGTYSWLYEYRSQMGSKGFFGEYNYAAYDGFSGLTGGAFAPYNFWLGGFHKVASTTTTGTPTAVAAGQPVIWAAAYGGQGTSLAGGESIVSGADASWQIFWMSTNMQIRMNQAVRIRGNYFIGSWNSPSYSTSQGLMVSSGALTQDNPGVQRSFSPGYWRTLWLSAQLPWGELAIGKRPSSWGMGLSYNGADNRSSDSLALSAPYGPFRVQLSFYPSRRGYFSDDYANSSGYYNERPDKNNTRQFDMTIPNITYRSGPVDAGLIVTWVARHRGGEGIIASPGTANPAAGTYPGNKMSQMSYSTDFSQYYGGAYFKYNNGNFFLNAEYNFDRQIERRSYPATNNGFGTTPPTYVDHDSGAVELGALCGPAKVSLIGAWYTGDDYRYGWAANSRGEFALRAVRVSSGLQSDVYSNTGVFRPYSYLMVYGYGLGTSFARDTGNGFVQDATFYGARLDYAAAANLNLFGSFAWAERFSNSGFMWGCLRPAVGGTYGPWVTTTTAPGVGGAPAGRNNTLLPYAGQVALTNYLTSSAGSNIQSLTPTIPDGALGYEIDAGFDWKLLEGLTARCTLGYWVPGKWFSYACADKAVNNWANYSQNQNGAWGTAPGKSIDPVFGLEFKLEGDF